MGERNLSWKFLLCKREITLNITELIFNREGR